MVEDKTYFYRQESQNEIATVSLRLSLRGRGVQYVHCVMHKCIMVKVGGNEIHVKYVKTRQFYEIRGESFSKSIGEKRKISRNRGK